MSGGASVGYLCLVLHAHLPYVRHPEQETFLEEDWLFEALGETYLPLLQMLDRLHRDRVPVRLTVSVSPTLAAMLDDPLLIQRYERHLDRLCALSEREAVERSYPPPLREVAMFYRDHFARLRRTFHDDIGRDVLRALRLARDRGQIELLACPATHAVLPLVSLEASRRAQVRVGVQAYRHHFGEPPRGMWLSECAYDHEVDALLADDGIDYFFVDAHGVLNARPRPPRGLAEPVLTPHGVAAFGRDRESSRQVWSAREGYPGDPVYREFYRDLGFDAPYDYIRPYLHPDGVRRQVGIKYHRVTGSVDLGGKEVYDVAVARQRARVHARDFHLHRLDQLRASDTVDGRAPVVTCLYDAELFGHWWFEGPWFLEHLFRVAAESHDLLAPATPSEVLELQPALSRAAPSPSTWGADGHLSVWLNGQNAWMLRHLHAAERRMARLVSPPALVSGKRRWALDQAARELLLAQSSDWAFILTTRSASVYAERRFREHLHRFHRLADAAEGGSGALDAIDRSGFDDALFPWLNHRVFA